MKVYPNPNSGVFTIELPYIEDKAVITVTDVTGKTIQTRVVRDGDGNKIPLSMAEAARGMYYVEVRYADQQFRAKLIIQ